MDLRHKVWIVLNKVLEKFGYRLFVPVGHKYLNVSLLTLLTNVFENFSVMHLPVEYCFDVNSLLLFEEFLGLGRGSGNLELKADTKATFDAIRSVAFEVDTIFEDTNSRPNLLCFFDMLGGDEDSSVFRSYLADEMPNLLPRLQVKVRGGLIQDDKSRISDECHGNRELATTPR